MNSILLIDKGQIRRESEAVLRILARLGAPWKWLKVFGILPVSWTDFLYRCIARNRYQWFGQKDCCTLSIDKYENRFILASDEPIIK